MIPAIGSCWRRPDGAVLRVTRASDKEIVLLGGGFLMCVVPGTRGSVWRPPEEIARILAEEQLAGGVVEEDEPEQSIAEMWDEVTDPANPDRLVATKEAATPDPAAKLVTLRLDQVPGDDEVRGTLTLFGREQVATVAKSVTPRGCYPVRVKGRQVTAATPSGSLRLDRLPVLGDDGARLVELAAAHVAAGRGLQIVVRGPP